MSKTIEGGLRVQAAIAARGKLQEERSLCLERLRAIHAKSPDMTAAAATRIAHRVKAAFWRFHNSQGDGGLRQLRFAKEAHRRYSDAQAMCAVTRADERRLLLEVRGSSLNRALRKVPASKWWRMGERDSELDRRLKSSKVNRSRDWDVGVELQRDTRPLLAHAWAEHAEFEIDGARALELSILAREGLSEDPCDALALRAIRRLESNALRRLAPEPSDLDGALYGLSLREVLICIQPFEFVKRVPSIGSPGDAERNIRVHSHAVDERLILLATIAVAALRVEFEDLRELDPASASDSLAAEPGATVPAPKKRSAKKKRGRPVKFCPKADKLLLAQFAKSNMTHAQFETERDLGDQAIKRLKARVAKHN